MSNGGPTAAANVLGCDGASVACPCRARWFKQWAQLEWCHVLKVQEFVAQGLAFEVPFDLRCLPQAPQLDLAAVPVTAS